MCWITRQGRVDHFDHVNAGRRNAGGSTAEDPNIEIAELLVFNKEIMAEEYAYVRTWMQY
jgi:hypothetical protein